MKPSTDHVRRSLFRKLLALAGLGITGVLLSQEKTGILPAVQAADGSNMVIGITNNGSPAGVRTALITDVRGDNAFFVYNNNPLGFSGATAIGALATGDTTFGNSYAVSGTAIQSNGIGVIGRGGAIAVIGLAGDPACKSIVAQGAASQTANLQEWQDSTGAALSVVDKNGNFGIGTSTPTVRLDVAGDAHATDFVATSDMRFKEEVTPIDGALDKVMRLQGVYFKWNSHYRDVLKRSNTKRRQVGVIAQQVREVLPEVVSEWGDESGGGYLGVDCSRLAAVTIEAVKEQQKQIQKLLERISTLEGHIKQLKSS